MMNWPAGNDLHEHIHLENNILFPKAVRLEQTVNT
jgi:iron-sulfur cluster repair protein YtfE (RIC family)